MLDSYLDLGWLQDAEAVTTPLMTFTYDIGIVTPKFTGILSDSWGV